MNLKFIGAIASGLFLIVSQVMLAQSIPCSKTYTLDADFDQGIMINVNHDSPNNDQLQLNTVTAPPPFIWVACSDRGTVVRIDVVTGKVLGEYWSSPSGRGKNPSRTTVDQNANMWVTNRNEDGFIGDVRHGSVTKIGIVIGGTRTDASGNPDPNGEYLKPPFQYCTAVDRNFDGLIHTSNGLGNVLRWPDITDGAGGATGIVEDAIDECILVYQRLPDAENTRHCSIDANNNVWVAGYPFQQRSFHNLRNSDGAILASFDARTYGAGGYGGLTDGNGILWSSGFSQGRLLRYDPSTNTGTSIANASCYGLGINPNNGDIWNTRYSYGNIMRYAPSGAAYAGYPKTTGGNNPRGVTITSDHNVWVANSGSATVGRLDANGNLLGTIPVGSVPTGVAVDANGKIWVTNRISNNAMRIDPNSGPIGAVELTVDLGAGAGPYNYSDMTGSVSIGSTTWLGSWTISQQGWSTATTWGKVSWNAVVPLTTSIKVEARASGSPTWVDVTAYNGVDLCGTLMELTGEYLEVKVTMVGDPANLVSPILYDLTIEPCDVVPPVADMDPLPDVVGECSATITTTPTATDYCDGTIIGTTTDPLTYTTQGTFVVTWTYTDTKGNFSTQTQTVIVDDITPPVMTLNPGVTVWPPNHKYMTFDIGDMVATITDNCDLNIDLTAIEMIRVWSDEPENMPGSGDGNTVNDIVIDVSCASVDLRKERCGNGNGRVYTILLKATDVNGQYSFASYEVGVPHNRKLAPVNDGSAAGYTVYSACAMSPKMSGNVAAPQFCDITSIYPNPFNPTTSIQYSIELDGPVLMKILDMSGAEVAVLVNQTLVAGKHSVTFDATNLSTGTYYCVLLANGTTVMKPVTLMK